MDEIVFGEEADVDSGLRVPKRYVAAAFGALVVSVSVQVVLADPTGLLATGKEVLDVLTGWVGDTAVATLLALFLFDRWRERERAKQAAAAKRIHDKQVEEAQRLHSQRIAKYVDNAAFDVRVGVSLVARGVVKAFPELVGRHLPPLMFAAMPYPPPELEQQLIDQLSAALTNVRAASDATRQYADTVPPMRPGSRFKPAPEGVDRDAMLQILHYGAAGLEDLAQGAQRCVDGAKALDMVLPERPIELLTATDDVRRAANAWAVACREQAPPDDWEHQSGWILYHGSKLLGLATQLLENAGHLYPESLTTARHFRDLTESLSKIQGATRRSR